MSRYIKKHRRQIAGFAAPIFFVFLLVAVGLSVAPGWIQNSYGTPGDSCQFGVPNQCDACNGEYCSGSVCANYTTNDPFSDMPTTNPTNTNPQCPDLNSLFANNVGTAFYPGCWNSCSQTFDAVNSRDVPVCSPNDQVCEDMSGGNTMNDCRIGVCTTDPSLTLANPSGCDYALDGIGVDPCINCEPPVPAGFDNCGNGVCEIDNGEDFDNCSLDCRVPGWVGPKLPPGDSQMDDFCFDPGPSIVFPVPPLNDSDYCEDGDICTENVCTPNHTCQTTPKVCDDTQEDLCCPAGCSSADDLDCIDPQSCEIPPPPPPPGGNLVEGSGIIPCSLQKHVDINPVQGMLSLSTLAGLVGALLVLRSRKS
jgi:hypothetical protein